MPIITDCKVCGKTFSYSPSLKRQYCSQTCAKASTKRDHTVVCKQCGVTFHKNASECVRRKTQFCSKKCSGASQRTLPDKVCTFCGKTFRPSNKAKSGGIFCSRLCMGTSNRKRVTVFCRNCRKPITVVPCHAKGWKGNNGRKFCSGSCFGSFNIRRQDFRKPTGIEAETYKALAELKLTFEAQYPIGSRVVDAYIPLLNLIVEVQGDFWHCNPDVYPNGPKNDIQRENIMRDEARYAYFEEEGYKVLEVWENDMREYGIKHLLEQGLADLFACRY